MKITLLILFHLICFIIETYVECLKLLGESNYNSIQNYGNVTRNEKKLDVREVSTVRANKPDYRVTRFIFSSETVIYFILHGVFGFMMYCNTFVWKNKRIFYVREYRLHWPNYINSCVSQGWLLLFSINTVWIAKNQRRLT